MTIHTRTHAHTRIHIHIWASGKERFAVLQGDDVVARPVDDERGALDLVQLFDVAENVADRVLQVVGYANA